MPDLWNDPSRAIWRRALDAYPDAVRAQGVARLADLDDWYRGELPAAITGRRPMALTHAELVRLTEWKMARGAWRAPNLVLVRGNDAQAVHDASAAAFAQVPHPKAPVATLTALAGVGPATASAALAAVAPDHYPFFDELVAAQVAGLPKVAWTLGYYVRYAEALRQRAAALDSDWTPVLVERALWANVGGKAGMVKDND